MSPVIIYNSLLVRFIHKFFMPIYGITLFPFILFKDEDPGRIDITHETIHFKQYCELWVIGFVLFYLYDYVVLRIKFKKTHTEAYYGIRFEKEAYDKQGDPSYPEKRERYSWKKYVLG